MRTEKLKQDCEKVIPPTYVLVDVTTEYSMVTLARTMVLSDLYD